MPIGLVVQIRDGLVVDMLFILGAIPFSGLQKSNR